MAQLQPGRYFYTDAIASALGEKPLPVTVREVGKEVLGVFFEGRQDYDLASEMTGTFEPRDTRPR